MRQRTLVLARRSASLEVDDSRRRGIGTYHKTPVAIRHSRSLRKPPCQLIGLADRASTSDHELQEALLRVGEAVLTHQRKQQEKAR